MNIGCIYSVDDYETVEKPLSTLSDIPFGISIIATILKESGNDVDLLVVSRATVIKDLLGSYIADKNPRMFCLTAVSSQFSTIENVAQVIKEIDPTIYVLLGGHHASLAPDNAIQSPHIDAICMGEGDKAVLDIVSQVAAGTSVPSNINNLWIKDKATDSIEKCPRNPFNEDLESLPHVDRTMWEPWIVSPEDEASVLVGRGCPYKCTYCSNHAMALLSPGKYTRYRSPADMIAEIDGVSNQYSGLRDIYLEVETIGASMWDATELFSALADYNSGRSEKLNFKMNLAIHSSFVKNEDKVREFLGYCQRANVVGLNVGLESGSERIRKIMRRPNYSNQEIATFARMSREHGISLSLYVLIGLPDETPKDFKDTVAMVREMQPDRVDLAVFYPYVGTDLYETAKERGMIPPHALEPAGERRKAILDSPDFPRWRVRFEYIVFWYSAFKGHWPLTKILYRMGRAYIAPHPRLESAWRTLNNGSRFFRSLKKKYAPSGASGVIRT